MIILNVSGNLTADPIVRTFNNDTAVLFTIASNEQFKNRKGETLQNVTYIRCAIWNRPDMAKLLYKGRPVNATGPIQLKYWHDNSGNKQVDLNLRISFLQVFGKNKQADNITTETHSSGAAPVNTDPEDIEIDLPF